MKLVSKKGIFIPKGTIFECCNNSASSFEYDNYDYYLELDKDTSARIIVSSENIAYFEVVE